MWIRREFEWREDERGVEDWGLTNVSSFDAVQGFGVAHDCMEHFKLDGSLLDEAHAFGAILWGREQGDWIGWRNSHRRNEHFADVMASDAAEIIAVHGHTLPTIRSVPIAREYDMDRHVDQLFIRTMDALPKWVEHNGSSYDVEQHGRQDVHLFCAHVRAGFRMAQRRWGKYMAPYTWADLFQQIVANPLTSEEPESHNSRLIVSISPKRQAVSVRLKRYVDPYDY